MSGLREKLAEVEQQHAAKVVAKRPMERDMEEAQALAQKLRNEVSAATKK